MNCCLHVYLFAALMTAFEMIILHISEVPSAMVSICASRKAAVDLKIGGQTVCAVDLARAFAYLACKLRAHELRGSHIRRSTAFLCVVLLGRTVEHAS